jgi:hypothetical protein
MGYQHQLKSARCGLDGMRMRNSKGLQDFFRGRFNVMALLLEANCDQSFNKISTTIQQNSLKNSLRALQRP